MVEQLFPQSSNLSLQGKNPPFSNSSSLPYQKKTILGVIQLSWKQESLNWPNITSWNKPTQLCMGTGPVWRRGDGDSTVVLHSVPVLPSALLLQWDPAMAHKSLYLLFVFSCYPSEDWKGKLLVGWMLGYSPQSAKKGLSTISSQAFPAAIE